MNLSQTWNANRKFAVCIFIVVSLLWESLVTIKTVTLPKTYVSTADVKLEFSSAAPDRDLIQSEAQTILSPEILNPVIGQLKLSERWVRRYFGAGDRLTPSETLGILKNRLKTLHTKNSTVISIMSFSDFPEEAAEIANAVAEVYRLSRIENQGTSPAIAVQMINSAQPNHRPYKPNIPLGLGIGVVVSAIFGAIAAVLAIGVRLLLQKLVGQKKPGSNDKKPPMHRIISKY